MLGVKIYSFADRSKIGSRGVKEIEDWLISNGDFSWIDDALDTVSISSFSIENTENNPKYFRRLRGKDTR